MGRVNEIGLLGAMPSSLPFLVFSLVLTAAVCLFFHLPIGWTALVVLVVWPLVGTLITADDDLPGGWSNPHGTVPPPWKAARFWADLLFRSAFAFAAFAITEGWKTSESVVFLLLCLAALLSSFGLMRWSVRSNHSSNDR